MSILLLTIMALLGVIIFLSGFTRLRQARIIQEVPTSTIRGAAMGLSELSGKAKPVKKTFLSPLTSTECVWYKLIVQEGHPNSDDSHIILTDVDSSIVPFFIEDNTGRILVLPKNAEFILKPYFRFVTPNPRSIDNLPKNLINFCDRYGLDKDIWLLRETLFFQEFVIRPEDTVYVLGAVYSSNNLTEKDINNENNKIIKTLSKFRNIKYPEWNAVTKKIEQKIAQEKLNNPININQTDLLIIKQDINNRLFIISNYSQKKLIKKLILWSILSIIVGMMFTIGSFVFIMDEIK